MDPFGVTSDTRLYVPRPASEAALAALRDGFAAGRRVLVLSGPAGLGKTMLLHVFAESLTGARWVHVPYSALAFEELAHWILAKLGEPSGQGAHSEALAALARREAAAARSLVLLLDDASALPLETARALRALVDSLDGALRLVAVPVDDGRASSVIAALGGDVHQVRLAQPLTDDELRHTLRERLARAREAGSELRLGDAQIEWLVAESGGVPRVANALATWLLNPAGEALGVFAALAADGDVALGALGLARAEAEGEPDAKPDEEDGASDDLLGIELTRSGEGAAHRTPALRTHASDERAARARMLRRRARRLGRRY